MKNLPTAHLVGIVAIVIFAILYYVFEMSGTEAPTKMRKMTEMPASLSLATTQHSYLKKYVVTVASDHDPIAINKMHSWKISVKTPAGEPVDDVKVSIFGGMPMHQHGLPTAPRVTQNLGQGQYLLEGMKFNMSGWWELKVQIDSGSQKDNATFNLILK